jgi:L(+)-tartrate dehydratase alpha subunit
MGPLRHNAVETFDEKTPAPTPAPTSLAGLAHRAGFGQLHHRRLHGRRRLHLPGAAKVLMPGQGYEGVAEFVMDVITERGVNACPPLLVGVGCPPRWKPLRACPSWPSCGRWIPEAATRAPR